jgi:hypothetical protein
MKFEIKKLITVPGLTGGTRAVPAGLNLKEKLWWRFMPGVIIKVKWPTGKIVIDSRHPAWYDCGAEHVEIFSSDPNDHYRPWIEEHIGKQGWDWDWGFTGNDVSDNCLTVKIRRKHAAMASLMALKWS